MNYADLFEAIGTADEDLLEHSEQPPRRWGLLLGAIAACLAIAITVSALFQPPAAQHLVCPTPITWSVGSDVLVLESSGISTMIPDVAGPEYQFSHDIAIEAKVLEVLPDTYCIPSTSTGSMKYRILRLKVLDEITCKGFPKEIYYRLPVTLDPNLEEYDSLILTVKQLGIEHYLMINETRRQAETFSFLFGQSRYAPDYGAVMAFTDGKLDLSLWDKEGWNESQKWAHYATADADGKYPGRVGRSIQDTKSAIVQQEEWARQSWGEFYNKLITSDFFDCEGSEDVFNYVAPFENGTFRQMLSIDPLEAWSLCGVGLTYQRIINGFGTNEYISIGRSYDGEVADISRTGPQFTEEDMENLPDLVSVINNPDAYLPETYHGDDISEHFCGVTGTFHKIDGKIYGVVSIEWGNPNWEEPKGPTCLIGMKVNECTHVLVMQDGTSRVVTEEELESIIGTNTPRTS